MPRPRSNVQPSPWVAFGLALFATTLGACWTSASMGDDLLRRVTALEEGTAESREELASQLERSQTKMQELEEVLEQATRVVTRASADTGAQVETLQSQIQTLEGQVAELRNELSRQQTAAAEHQADLERQLKRIASRAGIESTLDASEIPAGADEHFAAAERAYEARDWGRARSLFRVFLERHRDHGSADDAQLRLGTSFLEEDRPATALGELRKVISDFPQSEVADQALFGMADAFYRLHACTDARTALEALIRSHPRSSLVTRARTRLREIQRAPSGYCTS